MSSENPENQKAENKFELPSLVLENNTSEVAEADKVVENWLQNELGWSTEEIGLFEIAIREGIINGMMYGNLDVQWLEGETMEEHTSRQKMAEKEATNQNKRVRVELISNDDHTLAEVRIHDEGKGFDLNKVPDPGSQEHLLDPHGKGVEMMKGACDEVIYPPDQPGTLILRKRRKKSS